MSAKKDLIAENWREEGTCSGDVFRVIFDRIQTGILILDPVDHRIVDANPNAEKMLGYPKDKLIGRICHEFICPSACGNCPVTDLGLVLCNTEKSLITANGELLSVLKTAAKATMCGKEYIIESFIDASDRKKAEERKLALIAYMSEAILRVRKPLSLVERDLQFLADEAGNGDYDAEEIRLQLQLAANNLGRMVATLDELGRHALEEQKEIPKPFEEFISGECR